MIPDKKFRMEQFIDEQNSLRAECEALTKEVNKMIGRTNSPLILSMLGAIDTLRELVESNFELTRKEVQLLSEIVDENTKEVSRVSHWINKFNRYFNKKESNN